jgi:hypothetical protein
MQCFQTIATLESEVELLEHEKNHACWPLHYRPSIMQTVARGSQTLSKSDAGKRLNPVSVVYYSVISVGRPRSG